MLNEIKDGASNMSTTEKVVSAAALGVSVWMLLPVGIAAFALVFVIIRFSSIMLLTVPTWGIGIGCAGVLITISIQALLNASARSRLLGVLWLILKGSAVLLVAGSLAAFVLQNVSAYMPPLDPQNSNVSKVAMGTSGLMSGLVSVYAWIAFVGAPVVAAAVSVHRLLAEGKGRDTN